VHRAQGRSDVLSRRSIAQVSTAAAILGAPMPYPPPVFLTAEKITRSFGARRIFGPLSFEVEAGTVFGIAGRNGAGKTTLIKTLAGLIRPTSGKVLIASSREPGAPLLSPGGTVLSRDVANIDIIVLYCDHGTSLDSLNRLRPEGKRRSHHHQLPL